MCTGGGCNGIRVSSSAAFAQGWLAQWAAVPSDPDYRRAHFCHSASQWVGFVLGLRVWERDERRPPPQILSFLPPSPHSKSMTSGVSGGETSQSAPNCAQTAHCLGSAVLAKAPQRSAAVLRARCLPGAPAVGCPPHLEYAAPTGGGVRGAQPTLQTRSNPGGTQGGLWPAGPSDGPRSSLPLSC